MNYTKFLEQNQAAKPADSTDPVVASDILAIAFEIAKLRESIDEATKFFVDNLVDLNLADDGGARLRVK